jgi:hypothetical protein
MRKSRGDAKNSRFFQSVGKSAIKDVQREHRCARKQISEPVWSPRNLLREVEG